ncbi:hypothetical protein PS1_033555 [Malus domestica]
MNTNSMDFGRVIFALIGFSSSLFFFVPNIKSWYTQQVTTEKLRIISEALKQAEKRATRFQKRHDQILCQISSFYLINKELEGALADSRAAMNEALEFAANLRKLQMKIICSFPSDDQLVAMTTHADQDFGSDFDLDGELEDAFDLIDRDNEEGDDNFVQTQI